MVLPMGEIKGTLEEVWGEGLLFGELHTGEDLVQVLLFVGPREMLAVVEFLVFWVCRGVHLMKEILYTGGFIEGI